jgi:alcohol dehydrogenase class IV
MDTAKGIALIASNGGEIRDYEGANRIQRPLPPMLCIPTTAGSGADISQFAIITDVERQVKMAIISRTLVPNITLIDPTFLQSKPEWLIIASAIDALSHAVEAYVSSISSPFTEMTDLIEKSGLQVAVFDETVPNPTDNNVHDGVEFYKKNNCDSLITLGGGSSHDCGKGVGLVISNGGKIHDFKGIDKSTKPMPPYLAINTTAGTASEMTRFCIITDTSRKVKMAIVDWRVTPNMAIDDPLLMMGMPPGLTAATGMDALTHAVEAYVSLAATPMTDACALKAIEIIGQSLRPAVANGQDIQAREDMCYAQYLAGMAFRVCHKINAT